MSLSAYLKSKKYTLPLVELIVLSSSEDHEDAEQNVTVEIPSAKSHDLRQQNSRYYPDYKIIEGTNFAVDAFRYGEIAGVTTYFLTHFHSDHYVGLTKNFNMPIYMSRITGKFDKIIALKKQKEIFFLSGRLVETLLNVNPKYIHTMDINTKYVIEGIEVTPIDANQ